MDQEGYANDVNENTHEIRWKIDKLILIFFIHLVSFNHIGVHRFPICLIILYFVTLLQVSL
jgi:hypothetical protein